MAPEPTENENARPEPLGEVHIELPPETAAPAEPTPPEDFAVTPLPVLPEEEAPAPARHLAKDGQPEQKAARARQKAKKKAQPKPEKPARPVADKTDKPRKKHHWVRRLVLLLVLLLFLGGGAAALYLRSATANDFLWLNLEQLPGKEATILYCQDADGEWVEYTRLAATQNKEWVPFAEVPENLVHAFVAVEDKNFYKHNGVSWRRTVYAVLNELKYKVTGSYFGGENGIKQGASTIDQQLVKNLTWDNSDDGTSGYLRKLREIARAYQLDARYTKDEILEAYVNVISFTGNTAGVQAESRKLFGCPVSELSLAQCASLAAITRNPARYNPVTHPDLNLERRNYILQLMAEQGYIAQEECDAAQVEDLGLAATTQPPRETETTSYFTDALLNELIADLREEYSLTNAQATNLVYNGGLRVYSTVDETLQTAMERVMTQGGLFPQPSVTSELPQYDENGQPVYNEDGTPATATVQETPQAAMISLGYDGGVKAVVGGLGQKEISRGLNRATQSYRQVGSTMKPIGAYALALKNNKINWSTRFMDAPVKQLTDPLTGERKDWPANYSNTYSEQYILVADALAQSINTIAVRVGQKAGAFGIYRFTTSKLHISSFEWKDVDLAPMVLGASTNGISPQELAAAYMMFGDGGNYASPHTYTRAETADGLPVCEVEVTTEQVLDEDTAYIMNRLLRGVLHGQGTASGYAASYMDSIGKTGTTTDNKDFWFVGLTPYYVTSVWYGYDSSAALPPGNGSGAVAAAWKRTMDNGQANLAPQEFPIGPNVVEAEYCTETGFLANDKCPSTATGYYKADRLPGPCYAH